MSWREETCEVLGIDPGRLNDPSNYFLDLVKPGWTIFQTENGSWAVKVTDYEESETVDVGAVSEDLRDSILHVAHSLHILKQPKPIKEEGMPAYVELPR